VERGKMEKQKENKRKGMGMKTVSEVWKKK